MEKTKEIKTFVSQKGISLVALIITIIVMVILAGIIIVSAVADGGIIDRAQTALVEQEKAEAQDIIETSYVFKPTASQTTYGYLDMQLTAEAIYLNLTDAGFKLKKADGTEATEVSHIYSGGDTLELNIKGKRSEYKGTVEEKTGLIEDLEIIGGGKQSGSSVPPTGTVKWQYGEVEGEKYLIYAGDAKILTLNSDEITAVQCTVTIDYDNGTTNIEETDTNVTVKLNELSGIMINYYDPDFIFDEIILGKDVIEYIEDLPDTKILTLEEGMTEIPDYLCYRDIGKGDVSYLTKVSIPESVVSIGRFAFGGCTELTNIDISNVTSIGHDAFYNCTGLKNIKLSNKIESLDYAFRNCTSLENIEIPDSVTSIKGTFSGCSSLKGILVIPEGTTEIGYSEFDNCESLEEIIIPNSVTTISDWAFDDCTSLKSINIPNAVTIIPARVFNNCSSLRTIDIPNSVNWISEDVFYGCTNLTTIIIHQDDSSVLGESWIPSSVTDIQYVGKD